MSARLAGLLQLQGGLGTTAGWLGCSCAAGVLISIDDALLDFVPDKTWYQRRYPFQQIHRNHGARSS